MKGRIGSGLAAGVLKFPGKILTLVGPLLLYRALPAAEYAAFEVAISLSSLAATVVGGGLPAALPHEHFACSGGSMLVRMRRVLNAAAGAASAVVLAAWLLGDAGAGGHGHLPVLVILFAAATTSFLGQSFAAAYFRIHGRYGLSALVEHSIWLAAVAAVLVARPGRPSEQLAAVAWLSVVNALTVVLVANALLRRRHGPEVPGLSPAEIRRIGMPVMVAQLANLAAASVSRIVLLFGGAPAAAADVALATRLSAPVVFVSQVLYSAWIAGLFDRDPEARAKTIADAVLTINLVALGLFLAVSCIGPLAGLLALPGYALFPVTLLLGMQLTALLASGEISATAFIGTGRSAQRALHLWAGVAVVAALQVALVLLVESRPHLAVGAMLASLAVFGGISLVHIRLSVGARRFGTALLRILGAGAASLAAWTLA
jgi:O-antigen/teichoic acid export membrane protein